MQEQETLDAIVTSILEEPINDMKNLLKSENKVDEIDKIIVGSYFEGCIKTIKVITLMTDDEINLIIKNNLNTSFEELAKFYLSQDDLIHLAGGNLDD